MKLSATASDERMEWKTLMFNLHVSFGRGTMQHAEILCTVHK